MLADDRCAGDTIPISDGFGVYEHQHDWLNDLSYLGERMIPKYGFFPHICISYFPLLFGLRLIFLLNSFTASTK